MRHYNEIQKKNFIIYTLAGIALGLLALNIFQYNWLQDAQYEIHEAQQGVEMGERWSGMERSWVSCNNFVKNNEGFGACQLEAHDDWDGFWVEVTASPAM